MAKKLTDKEKLFVKYYPIKFNGTQSAIKAGYSKKTAKQIATENLSKPYIQEAIKKATKRITDKADLTQDMVIAELRKVGFSDIKDFINIGPKGIKIKDLQDVDTSVISSADMNVSRQGLHVGIKLHKKVEALELLGRYFGTFNESNKFQIDWKNVKVVFSVPEMDDKEEKP